MSTARTGHLFKTASLNDAKNQENLYCSKKITVGDHVSKIIIEKTPGENNLILITPDKVGWDSTVDITWDGITYSQKIEPKKTYRLNAGTIKETWIADEDIPFIKTAELLGKLKLSGNHYVKTITSGSGDSVIVIEKTPGKQNDINITGDSMDWDKQIDIEWDGVSYSQKIENNKLYRLNADNIGQEWKPEPYQPKGTPSSRPSHRDENTLPQSLLSVLQKSPVFFFSYC